MGGRGDAPGDAMRARVQSKEMHNEMQEATDAEINEMQKEMQGGRGCRDQRDAEGDAGKARMPRAKRCTKRCKRCTGKCRRARMPLLNRQKGRRAKRCRREKRCRSRDFVIRRSDVWQGNGRRPWRERDVLGRRTGKTIRGKGCSTIITINIRVGLVIPIVIPPVRCSARRQGKWQDHGENATFWDAEQEAGRLFAGSEYDANTSAMFD